VPTPAAFRRPVIVMVMLGLALPVAGCGASGRSSSTSQSSRRVSKQLAFNQCMRARGVPIPDTATTPAAALTAGAPASILQAAIAACRQYEQGAFSTITPQSRSRFTHALLRYAICLRAHGVNVPDPSLTSDSHFGQKLLAAGSLPNFNAANTTCRRDLGAALAGAGG
jgi:hypothetical protein